MNHTHPLVQKIDELVIPREKPALLLSGGIDSAIVLHHLSLKVENIRTYTMKFGFETDEDEHAAEVAAHYGTIHRTIEVDDIYAPLVEVMKHFDRPRFNIWPYHLFKAAKEDGCMVVYIGEGGDEHFGGYAPVSSPLYRYTPKLYLQWWTNLLVWILPMYQGLSNIFDMDLVSPLYSLSWEDTLEYHSPPNKSALREVYRGILPDSVILKKKQAPAITFYPELWDKALSKYFPGEPFRSKEHTLLRMQMLAAEKWLEAHKGE